MSVKEAFINYPSLVETVDGHLVGRVVLNARNRFPKSEEACAIERKLDADTILQLRIANKLNWNTPSFSNSPIGVERGASSYFTWDPSSVTVTIEWGEIAPDKNAKLHDYLNKMIDFNGRHKQGMTFRSGHISRLTPSGAVICLLDATFQAKPIVDTLNNHGFVVVDSIGQVQKTVGNLDKMG